MIYNLGRVLPVFRGTYNSTTQYLPLDIVYYNGSSYVAKQNALNILPTNIVYWQIVALKGELSPTLSPDQVNEIITQIESDANFVVDASYVHTDNNFSNTYKEALDNIGNNIGTGTLTIRRNNTAVGTFNANSSENVSININVPTSISDLTQDGVFRQLYKLESIDNADKPDYEITPLNDNTIYYFRSPLNSLRIVSPFINEVPDVYQKLQGSIIIFDTGSEKLQLIQDGFYFANFDSSKGFEASSRYRLEIFGDMITVYKLIKQ